MADLTKRPAEAPRRAPSGAGRPVSVDTARFAQLTYTSFDGGAPAGGAALGGPGTGQRSHGGGWQVKQVVGDLDPAYVDALTARIVTRFDLEPALPAFPTPDQIADRPARLVYAVLEADGGRPAAFWHTVDAGRDGTGRPGNVFAHLLATTTAADAAPVGGAVRMGLRPIELWRWPGWLNPYGPEAVKAAVLPAGPPALAPNPALSASSVVAFLLDPSRDRLGVVRVLLDAVAARMAGQTRGPVVLAVGDHDRAASWIAAVSHFLTAAGAEQFCWSTHDAPEAVAAGACADLHLVCVPRTRIGEIAGHAGTAVLIDENEEPYLGDPGSAHRVAAGTVEVTALSVLAEAVLADQDIALRVLGRRDQIAVDFEDRPGGAAGTLAPEWPIAIAVLEEPELAEFHADAAAVLVDEAPDGLSDVDWAAELVESTLRANPPTPDDALRRLAAAARRGRGTELLATRVVDAAVRDPDWFDGCDLSVVPTVHSVPMGGLRAAVTDRCGALTPEAPGATRAALRLAETIERLGAPGVDLDAVRGEVAGAVRRTGLADIGPAGWAAAVGAEDLSASTVADYVRPVFADKPAGELSAMDTDVALWLYRGDEGVRYASPAEFSEVDDYLFGFATCAVLRDRALGIPADARTLYAGEGIRAALRSARLDDGECRELVGEIVAEQRPSAVDLLEFSASTGRVPPQILDSLVFYGEVEDGALRAILDAPGAASPELVAASWLRLARRTGPVTDRDRWCDSVAALAESASSSTRAGAPVTWVAQAADELVVMAAAGFVVGQSVGAPWADPDSGFCAALRERMAGTPGSVGLYAPVVEELSRAEQGWVLDTAWVAGHSLTVMMGLPGAGAGPLGGLGSPSIREPGQLVPWSMAIIEERGASGSYRGPVDVIGVRDAAWLVVRNLEAAAAERFFTDYRRTADDWLVRVGVPARTTGPAAHGPSGRGGLG
ncbi:GAP1-N2 domain-containing protein [Gordonia crocea]|uniref:Uncharacterized protein n=1 Tax=Gordonia crocea TaxID=589162 RepID=A0A7I9V209_9ACTN|nr:hypothetical protein [Gordonia crocea]GED99468.1 hypothetical protein nbrc107697_35070 [Gordonia crocea]